MFVFDRRSRPCRGAAPLPVHRPAARRAGVPPCSCITPPTTTTHTHASPHAHAPACLPACPPAPAQVAALTPEAAADAYMAIVTAEERDDDAGVKVKEEALYQLARILVKQRQFEAVMGLLQNANVFFGASGRPAPGWWWLVAVVGTGRRRRNSRGLRAPADGASDPAPPHPTPTPTAPHPHRTPPPPHPTPTAPHPARARSQSG